MDKHQGKFLVEWLHSFTHPQLFFAFWAVLIGFFVYLFLRQQSRLDERQFKPGSKNGERKTSPGKELVSVDKKNAGVVVKTKD